MAVGRLWIIGWHFDFQHHLAPARCWAEPLDLARVPAHSCLASHWRSNQPTWFCPYSCNPTNSSCCSLWGRSAYPHFLVLPWSGRYFTARSWVQDGVCVAFAPAQNLCQTSYHHRWARLEMGFHANLLGGQKCHWCHVWLYALIFLNIQTWLPKGWKAITLAPPAGHRCCSCVQKS